MKKHMTKKLLPLAAVVVAALIAVGIWAQRQLLLPGDSAPLIR